MPVNMPWKTFETVKLNLTSVKFESLNCWYCGGFLILSICSFKFINFEDHASSLHQNLSQCSQWLPLLYFVPFVSSCWTLSVFHHQLSGRRGGWVSFCALLGFRSCHCGWIKMPRRRKSPRDNPAVRPPFAIHRLLLRSFLSLPTTRVLDFRRNKLIIWAFIEQQLCHYITWIDFLWLLTALLLTTRRRLRTSPWPHGTKLQVVYPSCSWFLYYSNG